MFNFLRTLQAVLRSGCPGSRPVSLHPRPDPGFLVRLISAALTAVRASVGLDGGFDVNSRWSVLLGVLWACWPCTELSRRRKCWFKSFARFSSDCCIFEWWESFCVLGRSPFLGLAKETCRVLPSHGCPFALLRSPRARVFVAVGSRVCPFCCLCVAVLVQGLGIFFVVFLVVVLLLLLFLPNLTLSFCPVFSECSYTSNFCVQS